MIVGQHSWVFENKPVIVSTGVVGGPFEAKGKLSTYFDKLHDDIWLEENSFEKAQRILFEDAYEIALKKASVNKNDVNYFIAGDLINQITPSTFTARTLEIPYF